MTDLKHALEEDQVIFGDEEIDETMQSVFAFSKRNRYRFLFCKSQSLLRSTNWQKHRS